MDSLINTQIFIKFPDRLLYSRSDSSHDPLVSDLLILLYTIKS